MAAPEFLERAKRTLRLVRKHQHLRNVADEVSAIRECLVMAAASPATIGITETDLIAMVRNGYLAEARIIFDLAVDKAASSVEKDFFFTELVGLIVKATVASRPAESRVHATAVVPEPAVAGGDDDPLAEIERLKAERARLAAELASADERIEGLRTALDARNAALLARFDPSNGLVPLKDLGQLEGTGDVDDLDFDGAFRPGSASAEPSSSVVAASAAEPLGDGTEDDGEPAIELSEDDIESEEPDAAIEVIDRSFEAGDEASGDAPTLFAAPIGDDEMCIIKFFGEKDAIALGLLFPLTDGRPARPRRGPPPLPRATDDVGEPS